MGMDIKPKAPTKEVMVQYSDMQEDSHNSH